MLVGSRHAIITITADRNARTLEVLDRISTIKYGSMEGPFLSRIFVLRDPRLN